MPYNYPPDDADVCIVAGDVLGGPESVDYLAGKIKIPLIFVPGNHEYWGQVYQSSRTAMNSAGRKHSHVHVLSDGQSVVIKDTLFVGGTLFTDFELFGQSNINDVMSVAVSEGFDFRNIKFKRYGEEERNFAPSDARSIHKRTLEKIADALTVSQCARKVIVSHYGPAAQSIPKEFRVSKSMGDTIANAWYASELTEFIKEYAPDAWVHGHIHRSCDYRIGKSLVLCNPRSFEHENTAFEWDKTFVLD